MTAIYQKLYDGFHYAFDEAIDPRTKGLFLVGTPFQTLGIVALYVYFATKLGPRFMKDRKPYNLDKIIRVYNILQVILNAYIFYIGVYAYIVDNYSLKCQPVIKTNTPGSKYVIRAVYFYYINKYVELLDTVFFVLRKKFNQVSYLHVYHHALMPIATSIGANWVPGGHAAIMGLANTFIHVVMYSYYYLSSLGPEMQKYLWWKKHLTLMQLIQFCIIFVHNFQVLFRECDFPKAFNLLMCFEAGYFFYLFGMFYLKTYNKEKTEKVLANGNSENKKHSE